LHAVALVPAAALAAYSAVTERGLPPGAAPIPHKMEPLFQGPADKLSLLLTPTLTTRLGVDVVVGLVLWTLLGCATVATLRSVRSAAPSAPSALAAEAAHVRALVAAAVSLGIAFLVLPHEIGWFGFIDGRLVPVMLLLCLLAVRRDALGPRLSSAMDRLPPLLAMVAVGWVWFASAMFQREAAGYREALGAVPPNARVLNLPIEPDSRYFTGHPFVHYDKLIMVDRPVVVSDVWFHQGTGIFPSDKNPVLHLPATYNSSTIRAIDWRRYRLDEWDYALVRTRPDAAAPTTPPELSLVTHQGGWWLYRSNVASPASL
jgi:hypothetical protein